MKFLADSMLGKLVRWLRMLGQDVTYNVKLNDNELLKLANKENRVLLTKDLELYKRAVAKDIDASFVRGKSESERLAEIANRYDLTFDYRYGEVPLSRMQHKAHRHSKRTALKRIKEEHAYILRKVLEVPKLRTNLLARGTLKQIIRTLNEAQADWKN